MYLIKFIFVLILILVFFYFLNQYMLIETFNNVYQTFQSYVPLYSLTNSPSNWFYNFFPISNGYTNLPWNNMPLGNITNMSYDLRGDPLIIPRTEFIWNNPTIFPIYNPSI